MKKPLPASYLVNVPTDTDVITTTTLPPDYRVNDLRVP